MKNRAVILLCTLMALSCASELKQGREPVYPVAQCSPHVKYAFSFGSSGQLPGQFRSPSSVALDSFGNLLVADTGNNRIQKFDASGHFLMEFGGLGSGRGELNTPTDAVENSLSMYVVDSMNERVVEYDSEGRFLGVCVSRDKLGDSHRGFSPRRIAFSESGSAFLTDVETDAVIVFSRFWEPVSVIGGFGVGEGRFADPAGLARERTGEILVCDTGNRRLQMLNSLGNFARVLNVCAGRSICEPVDVAVGPDGSLYVVDEAERKILVFGPDETLRCTLPGADGPSLVSPSAVAVSSGGFLYVVDGGADVVHAFKIMGTVPKVDVP